MKKLLPFQETLKEIQEQLDSSSNLYQAIDAYFLYEALPGQENEAIHMLFYAGYVFATDEWRKEILMNQYHSIKSIEAINKRWEDRKNNFHYEILIPANQKWLKGDPADHSEMAEHLASRTNWSKSSIMNNSEYKGLARQHGRLKGVKGYKKMK